MLELNFINEAKKRFYHIISYKNPRGEHVIHKNWGGIQNKLGGITNLLFPSEKECESKLMEMVKKRIKRGYKFVGGQNAGKYIEESSHYSACN